MSTIKQATYILAMLATLTAACKKKDTPAPVNNSPNDTTVIDTSDSTPVFKPETALTMIKEDLSVGDGSLMGMTINPTTGIVYIYQEHPSHKGFYIHAYDSETKEYSTILENIDPDWSNSNGSEGARIRYYNNKLFVAGGFSNKKIAEINVQGSTLTLAKYYDAPVPYDMTVSSNTLYCLTSSGYILSYNLSNANLPDTFRFPAGSQAISHNASLVYVNDNGTGHLAMFSGVSPRQLTLRALNNSFEKSVSTTNEGGTIVTDSKGRIYFMEKDTIIRYKPDLTGKEVIPATGCDGTSARQVFCIREFGNYIQVFYKNTQSLYSIKIKA